MVSVARIGHKRIGIAPQGPPAWQAENFGAVNVVFAEIRLIFALRTKLMDPLRVHHLTCQKLKLFPATMSA